MFRSLIIGAAFGLVALPAFAADPDCGSAELIKSTRLPVAACVDPAIWNADNGAGDAEYIFSSKDQRAGFAIFTENTELSADAYRNSIIAMATTQSGAPEGSIVPHDVATAEIDGRQWRSMHYNLMVEEKELEFINYYYTEPGLGAVQFIFWSRPADAAMVDKDLAGRIMPTVTIAK